MARGVIRFKMSISDNRIPKTRSHISSFSAESYAQYVHKLSCTDHASKIILEIENSNFTPGSCN